MELSIIAGGHLRPDLVFVHVKRVRQYGIHGRKIIRSLSGIPVPFQQPPFRLIHIIEKVSAVPYHLPFISRPGIPFFQYIVHQFPAILFIPYRQVHIPVFRIVLLSLDKLITETMDGLYRNPLSFFSHIFLYPMLHFPACLIGECEAENFLRSCHALLHQPGYTSRQSPCFSCSCRTKSECDHSFPYRIYIFFLSESFRLDRFSLQSMTDQIPVNFHYSLLLIFKNK